MNHTADAASARELRDVEYAQSGGLSLRFDASLPAADAPAPAAILVHGGAWVRGDRRTNVAPLFQPLNQAGLAWFSISYSLATDPFQIGAAVTDVEAAVRFIRSRASTYNIDPNRIVLIGESAGGQLAAMAALTTTARSAVRAVVAMYTPTDLTLLARTSTLVPDAIRTQIKGTPWEKLILSRLAQLSPVANITRNMPPFLFIHGDADNIVPLDQSETMCRKMQEIGASCSMITVPGGGHGMRWWEGNPTKAEPYKKEMIAWIRRQLNS